jgi:CheY-like chemotaxis protein
MNQTCLRILIIDDDEVDRMRLKRFLAESKMLHPLKIDEVVNGTAGIAALTSQHYDCVLLDYNLPDMNGLSILRQLFSGDTPMLPPIIMQTVVDDDKTGIEFVEAGAQDYLVKGRFDHIILTRSILYARERHKLLFQKEELVRQLRDALSKVKTLEGIIPICMKCKKIRDDAGYWGAVEEYISIHTDALFSHGLCPECFDKSMRDINLNQDPIPGEQCRQASDSQSDKDS